MNRLDFEIQRSKVKVTVTVDVVTITCSTLFMTNCQPVCAFDDISIKGAYWLTVCHEQGSHAPGKSWIFLGYNFQVLESPGKWVWSWKVMEI